MKRIRVDLVPDPQHIFKQIYFLISFLEERHNLVGVSVGEAGQGLHYQGADGRPGAAGLVVHQQHVHHLGAVDR